MNVASEEMQRTGRERALHLLRILLDVGLAGFACSLGLGIVPAEIALGLVFAAVIGLHALGQRVLRPTALDKPLLLCLLALVLGVIGQRAAGASLFAGDALWVYRLGAGVVLVGAIGDAPRAIRLVKVFVVAIAIQGLYGVVQHFIAIGDAATGIYARPSTYAFLTTAGLAFLAAALLERLGRRTAWLLAVPTIFGALFALVPVAWGAVALALGTMAAVGRRFKRAAAILVALVVVGVGTAAITPALRASVTIDAAQQGAISWARTLELIADHPVQGIGAGTFAERTLAEAGQGSANLLFVWAESGPLGLLAFIWFFGAAVAALRRGAKALAPGEADARAVVLGAAGVAGAFLVWMLLKGPLADGMIAYTVMFAIAVGLAASGRAAAPPPFESMAAVEEREVLPDEEVPPPARNSATIAAAGFSCAALGGLTGLDAVTPAQGQVAALLLFLLGVGYLPLMPAATGAALRGLAIFGGAAVLAARPFSAVLDPGSGPWWTSPSAAVTLAALVAGGAGAAWSIRRPGLVGPAPVAGALTVGWVAAWITLLEYAFLPALGVTFDPERPFSYNFAVGACAVGVLFVAWAGPLGFGEAKVVGVARRLNKLPVAVVAVGLLILAAAGLGR